MCSQSIVRGASRFACFNEKMMETSIAVCIALLLYAVFETFLLDSKLLLLLSKNLTFNFAFTTIIVILFMLLLIKHQAIMRMLDAFRRRLGNVHGVSYPEFGYYSPFYKEENLDTSSEDKNQFLRHHKTIVITGGASGLGKALAKKLLTYEWITVIILDIMSICPKEFSGTRETDPSSPTDHPDPTSQTPGRLLYFQCDVRDPLQLINAASCIIGQVSLGLG